MRIKEILENVEGYVGVGFEEDMCKDFIKEYGVTNLDPADIWHFAASFHIEDIGNYTLHDILTSDARFGYWIKRTIEQVPISDMHDILDFAWRVLQEYKVTILHSFIEENKKLLKLKKVKNNLEEIRELMEDGEVLEYIEDKKIFARCLDDILEDF